MIGKIQNVCKFIDTGNQTWPKYKSRRDWDQWGFIIPFCFADKLHVYNS